MHIPFAACCELCQNRQKGSSCRQNRTSFVFKFATTWNFQAEVYECCGAQETLSLCFSYMFLKLHITKEIVDLFHLVLHTNIMSPYFRI